MAFDTIIPSQKELISAAIIAAGVTFLGGYVSPLVPGAIRGVIGERGSGFLVTYIIVLAGQKVGMMM